MSNHEDVYFNYMFDPTPDLGVIYQIDKFKLNTTDYRFECDKTFMSVNPSSVIVYACKVDSDLKPWLLQLVVNDNDSGYRNYFFKRENNLFKIHEFTQSLTDSSGGSIEHKENEGTKSSLKTFTSLQSSGASAAKYYEFKPSGSSGSSIIQRYNLASYLGESDKKHKNVSGSEEYSVISFSSGSDESHTFDITFKGRLKNKSGSQEQEKTSIFESSSENTSKLKPKGQPTSDIVSGSGSSCKAKQTEETVQSEGGSGPSGSNGPSGESGGSGSGGSGGGSGSNEQPSGSQDSGLQGSKEASSGTSEISTSPSEPSYQSKSSSNITGIVCGAVFGLVGLIGTGILIYKCIR
ncbi:hypothetical protein BdWA1_000861 [Babesia duncani]|uniref:Uncharacterized protein n=1 Tax=Babesia duncani TaxID=323732 RepID=A0AAD9UQ77_9APIC|nr:hypothetical protein BdWA1_000861 [Babesia duncani]